MLYKLLKDGGELYKATGHGADADYIRALFYEIINGGGKEDRRSILRS